MERSDYSESSGDSVMDVEFSGIGTRSVFVDPSPRQAGGLECHPLHVIDQIVRHSLDVADGSAATRDAEPPLADEQIIRALLLQALYSFRCDRQLAEQLQHKPLYRWFVGLHDPQDLWDAEAYARLRSLMLASCQENIAFRSALSRARTVALQWSRHFRIDEALFDAWLGIERHRAVTDLPLSLRQRQNIEAAASQPPERSPLDRALDLIIKRIGDHALNSDSLAAALRMSRRSLYYLFERQNLTPTEAIRNIRLECCKEALGDPRQQSRKVIDIALNFGFSSAAAFSRQFKQRYGFQPLAFREVMLRQAASRS
ncbi:helix-turn-helix domain-containing protein [uncultured Nevskia sp.]|uniref:helix-turn-helix domain-containing protein n=1 Tax=uncultured Nevskia sp. TaxID=228950 RepID=UPI0025D173A5|nr:helix-turn-helix domain-containing protein [uncultured Nevskia sp.]